MAVVHANISPGFGTSGDVLYKELWHACAGPLATLPREGERAYYFPQGHIEQLEASTNQELDQHVPVFNLPSKILCKVVNVVLQAEQDTDEVFAQITLFPESNPAEVTTPDPPIPEPESCKVHSFCKTLTASDTSTHGGFSVLRSHADECLPPLDMSQDPPWQELVAKDLHGNEWKFRHIFRVRSWLSLFRTPSSPLLASLPCQFLPLGTRAASPAPCSSFEVNVQPLPKHQSWKDKVGCPTQIHLLALTVSTNSFNFISSTSHMTKCIESFPRASAAVTGLVCPQRPPSRAPPPLSPMLCPCAKYGHHCC